MTRFINNPAEIKFDPDGDNIKPLVKEVFKDNIARTLWLGIRQRYFFDENFERSCLNTARYLRMNGATKSPEKLLEALSIKFSHFGRPTYSLEFVEDLFPYVFGEQTLEYQISQEVERE